MFAKYKHNIVVREDDYHCRSSSVCALAGLCDSGVFVSVRPTCCPAVLRVWPYWLIRLPLLYGKHFSTSLGMLVFNIPVAILCSKSISPRFTLFSMMQVFLASSFLKIFQFEPLFDDIMLNVIFGGFLNGIAIAIALRGNATTGGTDFYCLVCV